MVYPNFAIDNIDNKKEKTENDKKREHTKNPEN
jgi:hypothetical protein